MRTVQGKNIQGYMKIDGNYYPVFCGKTLSFGVEQEEDETTSVNSGAAREFEPGMYSAIMEVSGVTLLDNTDNRVAITYLQTPSVFTQVQDWKISLTDGNGHSVYYLFSGFIRNSSFDKSLPGFSQSTATIRVSGAIDVTTIDPPPPGGAAEIIYSDWWTFPAGDTTISGTSDVHGYTLEAVTVLEVDREGIQHEIVTSTPTGRQCKHNNTTGVISFDTAIPSNGETVFVLFKVIL